MMIAVTIYGSLIAGGGLSLEEMEKPVSKVLTQLQDLIKQAKERGFKGYSTLSKLDLQLLLAGKPVPKKMKKNHVSVGIQTDYRPCVNCGLEAMMTHLSFKAAAGYRIIYDGDLEIDVATGEVVSCGIESGYKIS